MNTISFSQFDASPGFSGESFDPNEKEDSNGEFSALLLSFYVPPPPPIALSPASPPPAPEATGISEIAAGESQNVAPIDGEINLTASSFSVGANSLFTKLPNQDAILPETLQSKIIQPETTGQDVHASVESINQNVSSAPGNFWSGKALPANPKSDQTNENNVRLPLLRKITETSSDKPVIIKGAPDNLATDTEFLTRINNLKSLSPHRPSLTGTVFSENLRAETTMDLPFKTKIEAKPSIGLPKGLSKIFQALAEAPIEKPVALNFLDQSINPKQTEKNDSLTTETKGGETFSPDDLADQGVVPNAAQHLPLEKPSEKSSDFKLEQTSPAAQISEVIKELSAKISQSREPQLIKLRLRPAELGAVEIRVERNLDGKINAHLTTHLEATKQILTENISELRNSLQRAGWQVDHLEISCSSFSTANLDSGNNQSQPQQTPNHQDGSLAQNSSLHSENENSNSPDLLAVERNSHRLLSVRA